MSGLKYWFNLLWLNRMERNTKLKNYDEHLIETLSHILMIINSYVLAIFNPNQRFVMIRWRPLTTLLIRFSLFYQRCIKFYLTFLMFDSKRIFFTSLQIKFNLSNNYWNYGKKAKTFCICNFLFMRPMKFLPFFSFLELFSFKRNIHYLIRMQMTPKT